MSFILERMLMMEKDYLRIDEVALAFGVSPRSVQRWLERDRIAYVRTPSGRRQIPRSILAGASPSYLSRLMQK